MVGPPDRPASDLQAGQLARAVADVVHWSAEPIEHRHVQVAHRCLFGHSNVTTSVDRAAAVPRHNHRQVFVVVPVSVTQTTAIDNHGMIQQVPFPFGRILHLLQEVTQLSDMEVIDPADLGMLLGLAAVVRKVVVPIGNVDHAVASIASRVRKHAC